MCEEMIYTKQHRKKKYMETDKAALSLITRGTSQLYGECNVPAVVPSELARPERFLPVDVGLVCQTVIARSAEPERYHFFSPFKPSLLLCNRHHPTAGMQTVLLRNQSPPAHRVARPSLSRLNVCTRSPEGDGRHAFPLQRSFPRFRWHQST